jgi:signal transduction histidine kinase
MKVETEAVLAALPDTIAQFDADMRLVSVNHPKSGVFRSPPTEGNTPGEIFDPEAAAIIDGLIRASTRSGSAEAQYDTGTRLFRVLARQLTSAPDTLLVFQDLTGRRNAEQALTQSIEHKTGVLKSISHQLGAPLTAVLGYANLLTEPDPELDAATRTAMAQHMADQAWELAGMVEDLVAVARTELGDLQVVRVPVNLSANAAQVIESMGVRGSSIMVTGDPKVSGRGDPARVRQIVRNLLSNALAHGSEPITVAVEATTTDAWLSVMDRGPGLPSHLEREVFSRIPTVTDSDGFNRAGIGLWAAHELASLMDGGIEYSRDHGLSIFRLRLPILETTG